MKVVVQPSALDDLREGFAFYELQEVGVGQHFLETLFNEIDKLSASAGVHPVHFGRFHRMLSGRFPHAVYYEVEDDVVRVRAVLDLRRDPQRIARKLKGLA